MNVPLYIHAASAISPQQSYVQERFLRPALQRDKGRLYVEDADYAKFISPVAIRRMSRMLKIAITAAMQCLEDAVTTTPDAIMTGTGRGSVTDMEVMVKDLIRLDEEALNPTLFIQSTYNSPNGWIAMLSKCTGYNQTYVHRGASFELALLDAQLRVAEEGCEATSLVGCYDEMTEDYFIIKGKIGYWKTQAPASSLLLLDHNTTPGSIGGEGAAFFMISGVEKNAATCICSLEILQSASAEGISAAIDEALAEAGINAEDIDLVLTGMSGDVRYDGLYGFVESFRLKSKPVAAFKHLCGEYDTASGFGLWLCDYIIRRQHVPDVLLREGNAGSIQYLLFVNHYIHGTATVMLLQNCGSAD